MGLAVKRSPSSILTDSTTEERFESTAMRVEVCVEELIVEAE
jgi:hypothetical protein